MLEGRRVDVVTATDHQVLGAPGEPDEPIRVNGSQVAGVSQPSLTFCPRGVRSPNSLHDIAGEDVGAAQRQPPNLAFGQERPVPGRLVDGHRARLLVRKALPDRLRPAHRGPAQRAGTGALGEPVTLAQRDPGTRLEGMAHRDW